MPIYSTSIQENQLGSKIIVRYLVWPMLSRLRPAAILVGCAALIPLWLWLQYPIFFSHFTSAIPGDIDPTHSQVMPAFWGGDHIQVFYLAWKLGRNLLGAWSIYSDPYNFANQSHLYIDLEVSPQYWPVVVSSALIGPVAGYNLGFILFPLLLGFFGSYFLFRQVASSRAVCIGAAFAMTLLPYRLQQLWGGHGGGAVMALLPCFWGAVLRHRLQPRSRWSDAAAGLMLFLLVLGDQHQGFYTLLCCAIVFLTWTVQDCAQSGLAAVARMIGRWKFLLLGLVATVANSWALRAVTLVNQASHATLQRSLSEIASHSEPIGMFVGGAYSVGLLFWVALAPLALIFFLLQRRRLLQRPLFGFALALPLCIPLLVGVGSHWSQRTGVYEFFYHHVPFFAAQRVPTKMFSTVALILCLLLCASWQALRQAEKRSQRAIAQLVAVLFWLQPLQYLFFFHRHWPGLRLSDMTWTAPEVFSFLKQNSKQSDIVFEVPFNIHHSRYATISQYLATQTGARFADGYAGSPPPHFLHVAPALERVNAGLVDDALMQAMRDEGTTYLLLNFNHWPLRISPATLQLAAESQSKLQRVAASEEFVLYRLLAAGAK